ncbi:PDR/VanB family oxidoreductase [Streptomyces sp. NPDC001604]|uniref:PDR/VanB family oxidoreductase n=1 Tax=Streptomyces sp. NPDC001604 TaxID=3364593 RepID=UPI003674AE7D
MRVRAKDVVADGVVSLTLDHPDGVRLPDWTPGAHIAFVLPDGTTRQYSLCGDLWDPHSFRIAVLRESAGRGGAAYVHNRLMPGDRVSVGGVHNHFPLVSAWELLYGGRSRASTAFRANLTHTYGERVHIRPQDKCGLLDLAAWLGEPLPGTTVYCCGPAPLLAALQEACAHWPDHSLRTERFTAADRSQPARRVPFEVELRRTGRTVTVTPDVTVLHAVRRAGAEVLSYCKHGTCGTCPVPVLEGTPDHRDAVPADHERAADCMLPCGSRSHSDHLVLDL